MQSEHHVWIEEHTIGGRGVPFAPRTVYWVRQSWMPRMIVVVYSRVAAEKVVRERLALVAELSEQWHRSVAVDVLTTLPAFRQN